MIMEALPLFALYEVSILFAWLVERRDDPLDEAVPER
jgi:Sec-independent protein secretion pathway component TatC